MISSFNQLYGIKLDAFWEHRPDLYDTLKKINTLVAVYTYV